MNLRSYPPKVFWAFRLHRSFRGVVPDTPTPTGVALLKEQYERGWIDLGYEHHLASFESHPWRHVRSAYIEILKECKAVTNAIQRQQRVGCHAGCDKWAALGVGREAGRRGCCFEPPIQT